METTVPISFTDRELDVMSVLWDAGSATVAEVRERLSDDLAYTTVLTVLRTLEQKGYVGHTGGAGPSVPSAGQARGRRSQRAAPTRGQSVRRLARAAPDPASLRQESW